MGNFAKFTGVENPVTLVRNFSSQQTANPCESRKTSGFSPQVRLERRFAVIYREIGMFFVQI